MQLLNLHWVVHLLVVLHLSLVVAKCLVTPIVVVPLLLVDVALSLLRSKVAPC